VKSSAPADLSEAQLQAIAAGHHQEVAAQLQAQGRPGDAGVLLEQIWDFAGAHAAYRDAGRDLDALRMALETTDPARIERAIADIESAAPAVIDEAIELLGRRRRQMDVARLLAARDADPSAQADARLEAGDPLGAAELLRDSGRAREALHALHGEGGPSSPRGLALAAQLCWELGDAEGAARYAQRRMATSIDDPATAALLARALGSLGHDLAAQLVLERSGAASTDELLPGRYRVTGVHGGGLVGAAYVGFDRLTLQEVEIHLLLADTSDVGPVDPLVASAIGRFAAAAMAGAAIGHPAIRPVVRIEPAAGLVVLPRAEGPSLRSMIRPPGLLDIAPARARALVAFVLEGLAAAHERALVHGWLLPSQCVTDALGRPLVPPFGVVHLAGLAATRTGALEELMAFTAPELRGGGEATIAGDLFAVGALLRALLLGRLRLDEADDEAPPATPELLLAQQLMSPDPADRPDATTALRRLRAPVADLHQLERDGSAIAAASRSSSQAPMVQLADGIEVSVADSWDEATLAALCETPSPWWQPVLDRIDRTLILAPWPDGSAALDPDNPAWRDLVPKEALEGPPEVVEAIRDRLLPSSLVVTPSRAVMVALDDVLTR
jgi:serine/threonine protein kinase